MKVLNHLQVVGVAIVSWETVIIVAMIINIFGVTTPGLMEEMFTRLNMVRMSQCMEFTLNSTRMVFTV